MKTFKQFLEEQEQKAPDYSKVQGVLPNTTHYYQTAKGSVYAHGEGRSQRFKAERMEGSRKAGGKLEPASSRTVFMHPDHAANMAAVYQSQGQSPQFVPHPDKKGYAAIVRGNDYGPHKKGSVMAEAPYTTKPMVGMSPVEHIPVGEGKYHAHFGHPIIHVKTVETPK